jgi:hypothetical protein
MDGADDVFHQLIHIIRAAIGEFSFGERPDSFIGIEVRSVGGKMLDAEAGMLLEEGPKWLPLVSGGIIQQDYDGASEMAQQLTQKPADFLLSDVVQKEEIVEPQAVPRRTHRNSGNDRDLVASPLAMTVDGSLALRSPGPDHMGNQQEARFIGKDYMGAQPRSVFFIRSQSFCFQRSMAFSSRSSARRFGF